MNAVVAFLVLTLLPLLGDITGVFENWGHAAESLDFRAQMRQTLLSFGGELLSSDFYALPLPEWVSVVLDYSKVWLPLFGGVTAPFLWHAARTSAATRAAWESASFPECPTDDRGAAGLQDRGLE
ncbi:hypothetical protein ACEE90_00935 [Corynebacterium phoceense]|uniref:hypothetical protein n=1 Tax=Corynebacterium phoceense TaxID=1686286 RepID=UPI00211C07EB|nr:hypothetical protein [Corynebacterium phoceense]MCQ9334330.1 hypothetical protein [Corynebacterium phoceense]